MNDKYKQGDIVQTPSGKAVITCAIYSCCSDALYQVNLSSGQTVIYDEHRLKGIEARK